MSKFSQMFRGVKNTFPLGLKTFQLKDRKIEKVELSSGLNVCLISDPSTTSCSAALSCEIGSFHDGKYAGTAHFLEHMLFLGTKRYPDSNEYERFIYDNGGSLNGYTANDHSLYYFNHLNPNQLLGGLDRFSRFFYEPFFDPSCVDRERNAVHEEYKKNIESDGWRMLHVQKELADPRHPISQFNTGNLETMTFGRDYLIDWFNKHYSSEKMNLVVLGKQDRSELRDMVVDSFSPILRREKLSLPDFPQKIWSELKSHVVWIEPIKDFRELSINWEIPIKCVNMKTKPDVLLATILGHEGENSILDSLKNKGWAEGLSAGANRHGFENATFSISVSLTENGLKNWRNVVSCIISGMKHISKQNVPSYIYNESNNMRKIAYEFQQRNSDIAINYCEKLRNESIETFPLQSILIQEFNPSHVEELLDLLTLENSFITVLAKKECPVEFDRQEKWMFAKYAVFPFEGIPHVNSNVAIPNENAFIPTDLNLIHPKKETDVHPVCLNRKDGVQLYYCPDTEFHVPQATMKFTLKTPTIKPNDPKSLVLANLYLRFVFETLNPIGYDASSAGLQYDISVSKNNSISFSVNGYSQKCTVLLKHLLEALAHPNMDSEKFDIFKNSLLRKYQNASKNTPVQQSYEMLYSKVLSHYSLNSELASAAQTVTLDELKHFSQTWYQSRNIEAFVGGNLKSDEATNALDMVETYLKGTASSKGQVISAEYVKPSILRPSGYSFPLNVSGNAMILSLDVGKKTDILRCHWSVLQKLLQEPYYTELRTKQQTGYIVNCSGNQIRKQLFLHYVIQSNQYDARDLLSRTELFNETFLREFSTNDTRERFEKIRESSIERLKTPFDKFMAKMEFYNLLTFEEDCDYNVLNRRMDLLKRVQFDEIEKAAQEIVGMQNTARLAVLSQGSDQENIQNSYLIK